MDGSRPLGAALNLGAAAAGGTLLARMDDRHLYGAEHVWDMVLAREYSGAELVAKGSEFVYLARSERTVHRFAGAGGVLPGRDQTVRRRAARLAPRSGNRRGMAEDRGRGGRGPDRRRDVGGRAGVPDPRRRIRAGQRGVGPSGRARGRPLPRPGRRGQGGLGAGVHRPGPFRAAPDGRAHRRRGALFEGGGGVRGLLRCGATTGARWRFRRSRSSSPLCR